METAKRSELALRETAPAIVAQRNRLLASGIENLSIAQLDRTERYVALDTRVNGQGCTAFVALQQLIDHWLGEATLPAAQMDEEITLQFIKDSFFQQGLPSPSRDLFWQRPVGMAQAQDYDRSLLYLTGAPFDIFLPELPADFSNGSGVLHPELSVSLHMTLGVLHLPASAVVGISAGDVIRLPGQTGLANVGGLPIFSFQIHGDYLMIETTLTDEQRALELDDSSDDGEYLINVEADEHASHQGIADSEMHDYPETFNRAVSTANVDASFQSQDVNDAAGVLRIEDLPVAISFVLSRCNMRVAQLCTLQPGMTLPLEHPTPYVDVMAGAVRLARGELVRVGNDLGVELIDVVSQPTTPQVETTP